MAQDAKAEVTAALIGEQSLLVQCGTILQQHGVRPVVVATRSADLSAWAEDEGIPVVTNGPDLAADLAPHRFDHLLSITNLRILPESVLAMADTMAINFHDGPLPAYAGLHATSWALLNGEDSHGVTWHTMEPGVDEGDILHQVTFDIAADETAQSLNIKCYEQAIASFADLAAALASGSLVGRSQDLAGRSYFGKYQRPDAAATIDWSRPVADIDALIRALDFGTYENPLGRAKLLIGDRVLVVESSTVRADPTTAPPGTITAIDGDTITIAAADGTVVLESLIEPGGETRPAARSLMAAGLALGDRLPILDPDRITRLSERNRRLARHEAAWAAELADLQPVELPYLRQVADGEAPSRVSIPLTLPETVTAHLERVQGRDPGGRARFLAAAFGSYLARLTGAPRFHLALAAVDAGHSDDLGPWFAPQVPVGCQVAMADGVGQVVDGFADAVERAMAKETFLADLPLRYPDVPSTGGGAALALPVGVVVGSVDDPVPAWLGQDLSLIIDEETGACTLLGDTTAYAIDVYQRIERQFLRFLQQVVDRPGTPLSEIELLTEAEYEQVVSAWNEATTEVDVEATLHQLFVAEADRRPDAPALVFGGDSLTYRELDLRSSELAAHLQSMGVGRGSLVGVFMDRGIDMVVGLIGILKSGAAYVPLDPTYPPDRIAFMIEDSELVVLLTRSHLIDDAPAFDGPVVAVDGEWDRTATLDAAAAGATGPDDLAYVIYTSGSTGKPKGVMVTHGNVVNFLAGMDQHIDHDEGDTWLTVTSLSFDISVLEIFWSLTRGLELVVFADEATSASTSTAAAPTTSERPVGFSLFYFASDESEADDAQKYELLLEGARFADQHGFEAVWTPERHFYAFGGLYPNPAVTGAAIAAITENVDIRAGSCVLPLHHPARVAEEWSVVDNISRGRVGIAFAAGWQPVDFLLRPENFADRKGAMIRDVETVQRLWQGESMSFEGPNGPVDVRTLPRPVQPELPTWLTIAGNPDTFAAAGTGGHNVLTHLLGQSIDDVADKIEIYRRARQAAGHPGEGRVTLMLHTYLGPDIETVREQVRPSMIEYLRSSVQLIKEAAWSFPTFTQKASETGRSPLDVFDDEDLTEEEMEALLEHAFSRYFDGSALFGTPESCRAMVADLQRIGVDEIACQVDFGIPTDDVIAGLPLLDQLRRSVAEASAESAAAEVSPVAPASTPAPADSATIPELIERHAVTHFQCTPSMGSMLIADEQFRQSATRLKMCLMGGEAFPQALAKEITDIVDGCVLNVYGPTETTIWSSVHRVENGDRPVSIGRPLANQQMYVVDANLAPCPVGVPGELLIGGDGVTGGYLDRPELTDERFVPDHFRPDVAGARLYRTGDLVRYEQDGSIDFLGRLDFQVKIRGYRIELGEIEARLNEHETVREAVVAAREDTPGDQRLVAYVISADGHQLDGDRLRDHLGEHLPTFMVPSRYVSLDRFPLTPNKKTDRKALPAPDETGVSSGAAYVAPQQGPQQELVEIWQDLLGVARVGVDDNFFDLGGHSLLAVQLNRRIKAVLGVELSITDVFRFPTIGALTGHLENRDQAAAEATTRATDRAAARREARAGRRGRRRR